MKEAQFYELLPNNIIKCYLCPHQCEITNNASGICGVRTNQNSILVSQIYKYLSASALDPIEKKPLYHFYPGRKILSIGARGCNLKCPYCQNWEISQVISEIFQKKESSDKLINLAQEKESLGLAYTYNEPIIWFEYVIELAEKIKREGLKNVMVTNGFISTAPLKDLLSLIDAFNVDLKSFKETTYQNILKGSLKPVLNSIEEIYKSSSFLEVTTLVINGINDNLTEMKEIINYLANFDKNIPWHITRYYPNYKYHQPATNLDFMSRVYELAREKLNYVYLGNMPVEHDNHTYCPQCHSVLVKRFFKEVEIDNIKEGECARCGEKINIKT